MELREQTRVQARLVEEGKREMERLLATFEAEKIQLLRESELKMAHLTKEVGQLKNVIVELEREMERVRAAAEAKYKDLIQQVEEITGQKVIVDDSLSIEKTATRKLKDEIDRLLAKIDSFSSLEEENERRGRRIRELENQLSIASATIADLEREIDGVRRDAAEQYAKLRHEVEKITGIKMSVEGNLNEEKSVTSTLKDEITRLLRTIEELKKIAEENQSAADRLHDAEATIAKLQLHVRELEGKALHYSNDWEHDLSPTHHTVSSPTHRARIVEKTRLKEEVIGGGYLDVQPIRPASPISPRNSKGGVQSWAL